MSLTLGRDVNHPDVQRPWSAWSEEQTLHLAVPYSNPYRWRTRRELFNNFRRQIASNPNVRLYVGELAYGDRPHEVTGLDREASPEKQQRLFHHLDVQMRTDCEMFHKENIINAIVRTYPSDWRYGGWCDGDFTFTRHDWALEAIHLLQHYDFVQLFSTYSDLDSVERPYGVRSSFAWNYLHPEEFHARMKARRRYADVDAYYAPPVGPEQPDWPFGYPPGATGGAWAFRRSAFDTVGGMLETNIIGGGDWDMAYALVERPDMTLEAIRSPLKASVNRWQVRAAKLTRNIGCVDQHAVHHFHGSKVNRFYSNRWKILADHKFDPDVDLVRDWQGIFRWTGDKPRLRDEIRRYLLSRKEDDPNLYGERPLV